MSSSYADTPPQTPPGKGSRGSPGSPLVLDENELVSELAFARWKVEMANRLVVAQEKKAADERKAYKDSQDAKFSQYKQSLHKRVGDEFNNSKEQIEAVHSANLEKGKEYKAYLEEMKEMVAHRKEEWAGYGHELTLKYGQEQAERTKASLAESIDTKAEQGRRVKKEIEAQSNQIATQRALHMEEKRQHVAAIKEGTIGKVSEGAHSRREAPECVPNAPPRVPNAPPRVPNVPPRDPQCPP